MWDSSSSPPVPELLDVGGVHYGRITSSQEEYLRNAPFLDPSAPSPPSSPSSASTASPPYPPTSPIRFFSVPDSPDMPRPNRAAEDPPEKPRGTKSSHRRRTAVHPPKIRSQDSSDSGADAIPHPNSRPANLLEAVEVLGGEIDEGIATVDILEILREKGFAIPDPPWWNPRGYPDEDEILGGA